jgi:hypothetical protein
MDSFTFLTVHCELTNWRYIEIKSGLINKGVSHSGGYEEHIFWDITPYSLMKVSRQLLPAFLVLVSSLAYCSTL